MNAPPHPPSPPIKTWSTPVGETRGRAVPCTVCGSRSFHPRLRCEGFSYVRCARCGLVQMNPQPLPEEVLSRYRDTYAADYLAYELANEPAFLRLQELALSDAGLAELEGERGEGPSRRVLDIGCATGALLERLRDRGWEPWGVEVSTPQADYARRERGLEVHGLPLEENHFPPESFGLVLASHLIEHLNDPAALVREVRRLLLPGGRFVVSTPNIAGLQARLFGGRWRSAIFDHLYLFSVKTLCRLLTQEGLYPERIVTWGGLAAGRAPPVLKAWADRAAKKHGWGDVMLIRARRGER